MVSIFENILEEGKLFKEIFKVKFFFNNFFEFIIDWSCDEMDFDGLLFWLFD